MALGNISTRPIVDRADVRISLPKRFLSAQITAIALRDEHSKFGDESPRKYVPVVPRLLRTMPYVPLVQVTVRLIGRRFPVSTVGRASVVMNVRVFLDDRRQNTLVNVASGKAALPEVRLFVVVVEVQLQLLGELVVCGWCSSHVPLFLKHEISFQPSLFPAKITMEG